MKTKNTRKAYGSLNNRVDENKMFCEKIEVGTGMTKYFWSDRRAYEVVSVINQKHLFVREYDHKGVGECMSNTWELISNEQNPLVEMKFRYGHWYEVSRCTYEHCHNRALQLVDDGTCKTYQAALNYVLWSNDVHFKDEKEVEQFKNGKEYVRYNKVNVSFGVAEYYFDYEF